MSDVIEIGSAKASEGTIAEGEIFVEKLAGGGNIAIPVTIINGKKPGPCFLDKWWNSWR
ncbi:hypothetical protein OAQ43_01765 [Alphaproteobacteria bacterium]|nr:hypothetical protein [Alphaproteobacteria bacterium]